MKPLQSLMLCVAVLACISASCSWMSVGRITPQPDDFHIPSGSEKTTRIYFYLAPVGTYSHIIAALRRGLADNPTFKEAVYIAELHPEGVFCKITVAREPKSPLRWVWLIVSGISIGIIPYYDDYGDRLLFNYELYIDGDLKRSYHYLIVAKGVWWIGAPLLKPLLPDRWTESLVGGEGYSTAVMATARAFWLDAHADKFF